MIHDSSIRIENGICHACPLCFSNLSKSKKIYIRFRYKIRWLPIF